MRDGGVAIRITELTVFPDPSLHVSPNPRKGCHPSSSQNGVRLSLIGIGTFMALSGLGGAHAQAGVDLSQPAPVSGYSYRESQWWQGASSVPAYPFSAPVPPSTFPDGWIPSSLPATGNPSSASPLFTPGWTQPNAAPLVPAPQAVTITVQPNVSDALPGGTVTYVASVTNGTTVLLQDLTVAVRYDEDEQTVVDAPGAVRRTGVLRWEDGTLQPGETKTLTYSLGIPIGMLGGSAVRTRVTVSDSIQTLAEAETSIAVLRQLPATGVSDYTRPLSSNHQFLTPIKGASARASGSFFGGWVWLLGGFILLLIAAGGVWLVRRRMAFA